MTLTLTPPPRRLLAGLAVALAAGACACAPKIARADAACTPGTTKRIAFLLKQQTAFRYLHADVPFFQKTVEAAGYKVMFQSAENDPGAQVSQAENALTKGVDAMVI